MTEEPVDPRASPVRHVGCTELDMSMSLTHNHLAHFRVLTEFLQRQPSLF